MPIRCRRPGTTVRSVPRSSRTRANCASWNGAKRWIAVPTDPAGSGMDEMFATKHVAVPRRAARRTISFDRSKA